MVLYKKFQYVLTGENMAQITLELIKQLRDLTQVGMMDCKNALTQADGDLEKAIEILRKKGTAVATKRSENATNNGTIAAFVSADHKIGALLEVSCETDFAANTSDMQAFAKNVCETLAAHPENLLEQKLVHDPKKTVKILLEELIAKITENIKISRTARFSSTGVINVYVHPGATLATMVELIAPNTPAVVQLAKDICMQIAVMKPACITPAELDPQLVEKEQGIIKEQLKASGKPQQIIDKIMLGKMEKFYEDVCLIKQKYIKDDKLSIEQHIKNIEKEAKGTITIKQIQRFAIGGK
jgi:translation elongation factor Ts